MLRKVFLQTQFGTPHPWSTEYFANVQALGRYGWDMKVFTPNSWPSYENIEFIPMTLDEFTALLNELTGLATDNHIAHGRPAKLVSDFYPAYGYIFENWIQGYHYWLHTNWDMVYGRLDHFLPDAELEKWDIWSDDVNTINGIFCAYRNTDFVNNLFREVPGWEDKFTEHAPQAFDEHHMTGAVRRLAAEGKVRFGFPQYGGLHSYDRLAQHLPKPNLRIAPDGALVELFQDQKGSAVQYYNQEQQPGREIMSFHFSHTKRWPLE